MRSFLPLTLLVSLLAALPARALDITPVSAWGGQPMSAAESQKITHLTVHHQGEA